MANYHPPMDMLAAYSAGSLKMSQAVCVAAHIELCPECKRVQRELDTVGSVLLEQQEPLSVPVELKANVLAMLDEQPAVAEAEPVKPEPPKGLPRCLAAFGISDIESLSWRKLWPSIKAAQISSDREPEAVELLRIGAGASMAKHRHIGEEVTLILQGSFSDEDGVYGPGDFLLRSGKECHKPQASRDADCLCLTTQEGPIQFEGWFLRWLNPFIRKASLGSYAAVA